MTKWNTKVMATERFSILNAPWWGGRWDKHLQKHERIALHYILVNDLADGSHRILDLIAIVGYDRKAKQQTARAVITSGRREAFQHAGDYKVDAHEALRYNRICTMYIDANPDGGVAPSKPTKRAPRNKGAENVIRELIERIVRKAHYKNLWLPTMGKRNLRSKMGGLPVAMRYYGVTDSWRVPQNKIEKYRENRKIKAEFKRAAAWAFEEVKDVRQGVA